VALEVRWSGQARADIQQIADFWREQDRPKVRLVLEAIRHRANWLADGHAEIGTPIDGLPRAYRWYRERAYGYKLFYRLEGDPPARLSVITVRHGRQRPLKPSTLRRYASS
jgi:plasmid stabilization system protein ParE